MTEESEAPPAKSGRPITLEFAGGGAVWLIQHMFMLAALIFQPKNMSIAYESTFRTDQDLEFGIFFDFEVMCGMLMC